MNEPVIEIAGQRPESRSVSPATVPAVGAWAQRCVTAAEQLVDLNRRAVHTAIDEQRAIVEQAASERSWLGVWRLQAGYALASTTKTAAYLRHVTDIALGHYVDAVADAEKFVRDSCVTWLDSGASRPTSLIVDANDVRAEAANSGVIVYAEPGRASS